MYNKVTGIRIAKLQIQETGTYNQQFLRPYVTDSNINGQQLDDLANRMVGGSTNPILSPLSVVGAGGSFITRKATPEAQLSIPNGWDQRRIRFMMEVVFDHQIGGSNSQFISGYTDFPGVNPGTLSIAPEMIFYIDSITKTRNVIHHTPMGEISNYNVIASQHLLYDNDFGGFTTPVFKRSMRPEDIYDTMGNALLFQDPTYQSSGYDTRNTLRQVAVTSDRSLSTPANFVTSVVNNYIHASATEEFGQDLNAIAEEAKKRAMSESNSSASYYDNFLNAISNLRGGVPVNSYFTYAELQRLDPNVFHVTNYFVQGQTQLNQLHQSGQTQGWGGSDYQTMAATTLSNAVPALMTELMITRLAFKSTNHDITGQPRTDILAGRGFGNLDMTMNFEKFKDSFHRLIVNDITYGNMLGYAIEMNVDLHGETWIKISIDNSPMVDYVTPSFCDGMFSPVVTSDQATITNLTQDFSSLIENVRDRVRHNSGPTSGPTFI